MANLRANSIVGVASTNSGVTFEGPIKIKTQNYFYLPTGNTFKRNVTENIVENGLVLYLDAGTSTSYSGTGNTWTDLSGNNNTGTLTNGPTYSSTNGGSIVFDGVDDKVVIPMNSSFVYGTSPFAIDAWIYVTGYTGAYNAGVIWSQTVFARNYFFMYVDSPGAVVFRYGNSGGTLLSTSTSVVQLNTWMHVCFTRVGTGPNQFFIYVNGVQEAVSTVSYDFNDTTYIPTIGQYTHSNELPFLGRISNLKVYNGKALSAEEISQNFNALRGRYGI